MASQFYWALSLEELEEDTPEIKAGAATLYNILTDEACGGGRAWLERAAALSVIGLPHSGWPPTAAFPDLVGILEPATITLKSRKNQHQAGRSNSSGVFSQ
ncbi:MAG: hypothetical protein R3F37_03520 [Candidatus Competibacteraceae bacterium]